MPERMSDGKFSGLYVRADNNAGSAMDAKDLAHEAARARAEAEEKDAQIKALADALISTKTASVDGSPCWCGFDVTRTGFIHGDRCAKRREALRLVGRLP